MKRKLFICFMIILILSLSQYKLLLTEYAKFFTVDNPTYGMNSAIVILSGGMATRVPKALELYNKGYSKRLLITTLRPMKKAVAHLFLANWQRAQLITKDLNMEINYEIVPSLKGGATSTFDEAYDLLEFCSKEKINHLILVTDAFHTRRALYAFKKIFLGSGIKVEASAAVNDVFNEENWWRSDNGISVYFLEPLKFAVYLFIDANVSFIQNN